MQPINQQELTQWLSLGLGRPYLYFLNHDIEPYRDTLLHACLYDVTYDWQCEGNRAKYLYKIIKTTSQTAWFTQQILDKFANPSDEMYMYQLFEFAYLFAQEGNSYARQLMYEQFRKNALENDTTGASDIIDLDGIDGFLFVAEELGKTATIDPDFYADNYLLWYLRQNNVNEIVDKRLQEAKLTSPFIKKYLEAVEEAVNYNRQSPNIRQEFLSQSYVTLRSNIFDPTLKNIGFLLRQWGEKASEQEIEQAAIDLLANRESDVIIQYLSIFCRRAFPLDYHLLLPLIYHKDEYVVVRTIELIAQLKHPDIHALGVELIATNYYPIEAVGLFVNNYQLGDEDIFMTLLEQLKDRDEIHGLGFGVSDVFKHNPTKQATPLLLALYECNPCSICRSKFVQCIANVDMLPQWLIDECQHDANEETRKIVQTVNDNLKTEVKTL